MPWSMFKVLCSVPAVASLLAMHFPMMPLYSGIHDKSTFEWPEISGRNFRQPWTKMDAYKTFVRQLICFRNGRNLQMVRQSVEKSIVKTLNESGASCIVYICGVPLEISWCWNFKTLWKISSLEGWLNVCMHYTVKFDQRLWNTFTSNSHRDCRETPKKKLSFSRAVVIKVEWKIFHDIILI